jgi:hypothetical protein
MKRLKQLTLAIALVMGVGFTALPANDAGAINVLNKQCDQPASSASPVCEAAKDDNATDMTKVIINTMLYILGILAVIMIIFGGIRYVTSTGDASRVKGAKDTVLYSVVGLIVALLAYAIVNFVITRF